MMTAKSTGTSLLVSAVLLVGLNACGSGGGGESLTGQFAGTPISGLRYTTASQSGTTSASGEFRYRAGETVSFYVGDILVGQTAGAATITPFDLVGMSPATDPLAIARLRRDTHGATVTSADRLVSIAVFLQTLDEDGDPANGIQIPAAMHGIAAAASLSFHRKWYDFFEASRFRLLLGRARSQGVWGGVRAIRKPPQAMSALYAGLGLSPTTCGTTVIQQIGTSSMRESFTYNADGNMTLSEVDTDGDGTVDHRRSYTYDGNGYLALIEYDGNADDTVSYSFDADGNMTSYATDNASYHLHQSFTYDANGNLTHVTQHLADATADPRDSSWSYSYDANGNVTLYEGDTNADGTVDFRDSYSYDAHGDLILHENDMGADGIADSRDSYSYDADGNLTLHEVDADADGAVESRESYSYDAGGNLTLREEDRNADVTVDSRDSYDANGNLTLHEEDTNADGTVNSRDFYSYDANGNMTLHEVDTNADGTVDLRASVTYDANGCQTLSEVDENADGTVDYGRSLTSVLLPVSWAYVIQR